MYEITDYTKKKAKEIGCEVKQSTNPKKKIDVWCDGQKIASIGATGYGDFPTFLREKGVEYAEKRRRLYHQRHPKDSLGEYLARWLLW